MRVLHVITGLGMGGAETVLCRVLESLRSPDYEHIVVALGKPGPLSSFVGSLAELHHLDMDPARPRVRDLLRLRRIVGASAPDVVHGWMYHANVMAAVAMVGLRSPLLWGIHHSLYELSNEKWMTRLVIKVGALFSRKPRHILYCSSVSSRQHEAAGYSKSRTFLIPNGFDLSAFRPDETARQRIRAELELPPDSLLIGLIARVQPIKDHPNFLSAARLLVTNYPGAYFVLVGDGADVDNRGLVGLIHELGLQSKVRLCGRRADVAAINAALDIASVSSWGEAFPMTIGEAMACGVPCVATEVGDIPEIIGDTGLVVPPRDAAALAAGWAKMASHDEQARRALGARARQRIAERYSLPAVARQYSDLYISLMQNRNR